NWVAVGRPFADLTQDTPTFDVTGVDFRVQVPPAVPLACDTRRDLLAVFGGGIPALLAFELGGKQQLVASTLVRRTQDGGLQGQSAFVKGRYRHVLNRNPDPTGLNAWVQQLQMGVSRSQLAAVFWNSAEHRTIEVDFYYQTYLGRPADPAGRTAWVNALLSGM